MRRGNETACRVWRRFRVFAALAATLPLAPSSLAAAAPDDADDAGPYWSYSGETGPAHWGALSSAYSKCQMGKAQSPIDIHQTQRVAYTPLSFQYRSQLFEAVNTGTGVHVISPPGSALLIRGEAFDLAELDFHAPGEHRFNGVLPEAELHLVHRDRRGGHVMVAIPLMAGQRENRILSRILDYFPMKAGEHVRHRQVGVNPLFLLPSNRSYFRYTGSLATPPCTEPVLWLVFEQPLEVSRSQIERIQRAVAPNSRPVQPLNERTVFSLVR